MLENEMDRSKELDMNWFVINKNKITLENDFLPHVVICQFFK